jgi:hypothetical protein
MKVAEAKHQYVFSGVTHNVFHCDVGVGIPMHQHTYSHATACHSGRIAIRKLGVYVEMTKDSTPVTLKADEPHEIEALEDGTVFENVFPAGAL